MKYHIVTIPAVNADEKLAELNQFIASHSIVHVSKELVSEGGVLYWCFLVEYLEQGVNQSVASNAGSSSKKGIDYQETLSPDDFARFAELRDIRNNLAKQENKKPFTVLNNAQLAELITKQITTKQGMSEIKGIGESRVDLYAEYFLPVLIKMFDKAAK